MKKILKLAWLTPILVLLMACTSTPTAEPETAEVEEAAPTQVVESQESEQPTEEPEPTATEEIEEMEEVMEEVAEEEQEADSAPAAVDGPTHEPATTVLEALSERPYDQAKGADEPLLTIIEYGDFQ